MAVTISRQAAAPGETVKGVLNVLDSGKMVISGHGACQTGYSDILMLGLTVGYSGMADVVSGHPFDGEMTIASGAEVSTLYGDAGIGVGYATGRLVVDGGFLNFNDHDADYSKWNYPARTFGVGLFGGLGTCVFQNGATFTSLPDVFVGGASTNRYPFQGGKFHTKLRMDHSATGTLVVADAAVAMKGNLVLGADGYGIVRRIGSTGSFTAANLVCTNVAGIAATGSRIDFVFDASGVGAVDLSNSVAISDGARLNVDMSAYAGRRRNFKLLGCKTHTGEFADMTLSGFDAEGRRPWFEWTERGLYLKMKSDFVINFR